MQISKTSFLTNHPQILKIYIKNPRLRQILSENYRNVFWFWCLTCRPLRLWRRHLINSTSSLNPFQNELLPTSFRTKRLFFQIFKPNQEFSLIFPFQLQYNYLCGPQHNSSITWPLRSFRLIRLNSKHFKFLFHYSFLCITMS